VTLAKNQEIQQEADKSDQKLEYFTGQSNMSIKTKLGIPANLLTNQTV
jgi:hypothetical protein